MPVERTPKLIAIIDRMALRGTRLHPPSSPEFSSWHLQTIGLVILANIDRFHDTTQKFVQLQQVSMNLMLNAIEAMQDSGGELTVKSELQDDQLQFSVSDTGVGLPMEKMDQIFSAFFTTKPQGSGMGLAISRSIVESHGGQLWASANSGGGATFHFTLPIHVTELSPLVA